MGIGILFWIAFFVWVGSEIGITIQSKRLRKNVLATKLDKGSSWIIIIGVYVGVRIAFELHFQKWGRVSQPIADIGAVLMLMGVVLRLWSIQVLGRNFSTVVSVDSNQKIIKNGPYKLIRHPAYTGALITLVFIGLALNSWVASCILLFMLLPIYGYRIHVEEKALISHFHSAYEDYRQNTWRIIPYVW